MPQLGRSARIHRQRRLPIMLDQPQSQQSQQTPVRGALAQALAQADSSGAGVPRVLTPLKRSRADVQQRISDDLARTSCEMPVDEVVDTMRSQKRFLSEVRTRLPRGSTIVVWSGASCADRRFLQDSARKCVLVAQTMAADISRMNVAPLRIVGGGDAQAVPRCSTICGSSPPSSSRTQPEGLPSSGGSSSLASGGGMGSPPLPDGFNPFATPLPRIRGADAAANGAADMLSPQRLPADRHPSALPAEESLAPSSNFKQGGI